MIEEAVVLAAGSGTRMEPYSDAVPKELVLVGTKPMASHVLSLLAFAGIKKVYVIISKGKELISKYVQDGNEWGLQICYIYQDHSKGKGLAKAIECARPYIKKSFIVLYCDAFFYPKSFLKRMIAFHESKKADVTLNIYERDDPLPVGIVDMDENNRIKDLVEKPTLGQAHVFQLKNGMYNTIGGCFITSPAFFDFAENMSPGIFDEYQATDCIRSMLVNGLKVYGFKDPKLFFRDIGTFPALLNANEFYYKNIYKTPL